MNKYSDDNLAKSVTFYDRNKSPEKGYFKYRKTKDFIDIMQTVKRFESASPHRFGIESRVNELNISHQLNQVNTKRSYEFSSKTTFYNSKSYIRKIKEDNSQAKLRSALPSVKASSAFNHYFEQQDVKDYTMEFILPEVRQKIVKKIQEHRMFNDKLPKSIHTPNLSQLEKDLINRLAIKVDPYEKIEKRQVHLKNIHNQVDIENLHRKVKKLQIDKNHEDPLYLKVEKYIQEKIRSNSDFIENYIKKNFEKMAEYDYRIKKLSRISERSLYLFLVRYYHPESCEMIMSFLKINAGTRYSKEDMVKIIKDPETWVGRRVVELGYNIYNTNGIGNIDTNDLVTFLKCVYCKHTNTENFMNDDIMRMCIFLEQKKAEHDLSLASVNSYRTVYRYLKKDLVSSIKGYSDPSRAVEKLTEKINTSRLKVKGKEDPLDQINFDEFKTIPWIQIPGQDFGLPQVIVQLVKIFTNIDFHKKDFINIIEKLDRRSPFTSDISTAYKDFISLCDEMEVDYYNVTVHNEQLLKFDQDERWFKFTEAFYSLCDSTNRITMKSLQKRFENTMGLIGIEKFCEKLYMCMSQGFPVNLYKYIHFYYKYNKEQCLLLWNVMDLNNDEDIGNFEIEFFKDIFEYYKYVLTDFYQLENSMENFGKSRINDFYQFAQYLNYKSACQNFVYLILMNDKDWKSYGSGMHVNVNEKNRTIMNFQENENYGYQ